MANLGFLGLGIMGGAMARNLMSAGHNVALWSHSEGKAEKIPAQTREPQHTHHDRVVVSLSGAELEHILPNGKIQPSTLKTGEVVWRLGGTHIGHNMGQTDLWVIAIEPK